MTTNKEKALWLQKHYGGYSLQWYLSDITRLNAIYKKEYSRFIALRTDNIKKEHNDAANATLQRLKKAYFDVYRSDYDTDNAISRSETNARAQAIRDLWLHEEVAVTVA